MCVCVSNAVSAIYHLPAPDQFDQSHGRPLEVKSWNKSATCSVRAVLAAAIYHARKCLYVDACLDGVCMFVQIFQ